MTHHYQVRPVDLSYREMTLDRSGSIMPKEAKLKFRRENGFCLTCPHVPVQLFNIRKSKLNPLWSSKSPCTIPGESLDGRCLKCQPDIDSATLLQGSSPDSPFSRQKSCRTLNSSCSSLSMSDDLNRSLNGSSQNLSFEASQRSGHSSHSKLSLQEASGVRHIPSERVAPIRSFSGSVMRSERFLERQNSASRGTLERSKSERLQNSRVMSRSASVRQVPLIAVTGMIDSSFHNRNGARDPSTRLPLPKNPSKDEIIVEDLTCMLKELRATSDLGALSDAIVGSMRSYEHNKAVQLFCLKSLLEDLRKEPALLTVVTSYDAHVAIIKSMSTFPFSLEVQEEGCTVLGVIAADERVRSILVREGACDAVDKALGRHFASSQILENTLSAARALSLDSVARERFHQLSFPQKVLSAMKAKHARPSVQRNGCAFLSNMAIESDSEVSIVDPEIFQVVVLAIERNQNDITIAESACFALKNLTLEESNLKTLSKVDGILRILFGALKNVPDAEVLVDRLLILRAQEESMGEEAEQSLTMLSNLEY